MSTITNDCTRRWTINHPPSLNRTWRGLGVIHGVIHRPPKTQQTQQQSSFRVSVEGCTPLFLPCSLQGFTGLEPVSRDAKQHGRSRLQPLDLLSRTSAAAGVS